MILFFTWYLLRFIIRRYRHFLWLITTFTQFVLGLLFPTCRFSFINVHTILFLFPLKGSAFNFTRDNGRFTTVLRRSTLRFKHLLKWRYSFPDLFPNFPFLGFFSVLRANFGIFRVLLMAIRISNHFVFVREEGSYFLSGFDVRFQVRRRILCDTQGVLMLLTLRRQMPTRLEAYAISVRGIPVLIMNVSSA